MLKVIRYCLFIPVLFFSICNVSAQKKLKGIGAFRTTSDSVFNFIYNKDTVNDGSYTSIYKILNVPGFYEVDVVHLQSEQRIEINFTGSKGSNTQKKIIKYQSNGGYIFIDYVDTVQFDTEVKYKLVLFFDNTQKEGFVFINQLSVLTEDNPKINLHLDPIPNWMQKENKSKVDYYLLKGTPERRVKYMKFLDSLNHEKRIKWIADSISLGVRSEYAYKQKAFQEKRDTTVLNASIPLTNEYLTITRKELRGIVDTMLRNYESAYFNSYAKFLIDTSGEISDFDIGTMRTDISNSKSFMNELKNRIANHKLKTMMMYDDSGVAYTMATKIQFAINFNKQTSIIHANVYKHAEPKLTGFTLSDQHYKSLLIDSLKKMKSGKYRMTIDYRNIINDTSYTISKLKNISDKSYLKIGITYGTFFSQTGSNPINYKSDLNFPYLSINAIYKYGGLFFGSAILPLYGTKNKGISSESSSFVALGNPVSTYNSDMKYSEYGIYLSPAHLIYIKAGMNSRTNAQIIYEFPDNLGDKISYQNISNSKGYLFGVAFAPKFFTLEAGYNSLINNQFLNLGFNIPVNINK